MKYVLIVYSLLQLRSSEQHLMQLRPTANTSTLLTAIEGEVLFDLFKITLMVAILF